VATGCTADKPSYVGGTVKGYTDGRALDVALGIGIATTRNGAYTQLAADGTTIPRGYSWIEKLNPTYPPTGVDPTTDPAAQTTWGQCVAGSATRFDVEVYPKDPIDPANPDLPQVTDKIRYASTAYYSGVITPGTRMNLALRVPVTFQAGGGNTGGVQGYITYAGKPVPKSAITRVRAFPGPGYECGIRGYSASDTDKVVDATGPARTYYKVDYLVGGQCGAATQGYALQMTCHLVCGATDRDYSRRVDVSKGLMPRFDVVFG
jgi:hypothetical protein